MSFRAFVDAIAGVCMMDLMCLFAEQLEHLESIFTLTLRAETDQVSHSLGFRPSPLS